MNEQLDQLANLVYEVADNAEFLDSDKVLAITTKDQIAVLWGDLDYLKGILDKATALAREMMND